MPNLRKVSSRSSVEMAPRSSPSTRTVPPSAGSSPRMVFTSTDLPEPEPPITTRLSPAATSRSMPSSTILRPKDFLRPRTEILGGPAMSEHHAREDVVDQQHGDRGGHDGVGGGRAHALRAAARVIAEIAAHHG